MYPCVLASLYWFALRYHLLLPWCVSAAMKPNDRTIENCYCRCLWMNMLVHLRALSLMRVFMACKCSLAWYLYRWFNFFVVSIDLYSSALWRLRPAHMRRQSGAPSYGWIWIAIRWRIGRELCMRATQSEVLFKHISSMTRARLLKKQAWTVGLNSKAIAIASLW